MPLSKWLAQPKVSRESVLTELRDMAKEWKDGGDENTQEDATTLLAAVEVLAKIDEDLDSSPNKPGVGS